MALSDLTKRIQIKVGTSVDGIYGKNTALAIIKSLDSTAGDLTTIIQRKVDTIPLTWWQKFRKALGLYKDPGQPVHPPSRSQEVVSAKPPGTYPEVFKKTPNISSSKITPEGVILHHSSGSYGGSVSWILQSKSQVSYHAIINTDGSRTSFAADDRRAWHAGESIFKGRANCNGFLLGLAFSGDTNRRELTEDEVASAIEWLVPRFKEWGWPRDLSTITTHKEVSPGRKNDVDDRAFKKIKQALKEALND